MENSNSEEKIVKEYITKISRKIAIRMRNIVGETCNHFGEE